MTFIAPALPFLAVGSALFSGVAAVEQGQAQKRAYEQQAQQAQIEGQQQQQIANATAQQQVDQAAEQQAQDRIAAQNATIQAKQDQAIRLQNLQRTIGVIDATVATRGLTGPSAMALEGAAQGYTQRDIINARFNAFQNAANYGLAGRVAMSQGNAQASQTILEGIYAVRSGTASAANLRASGSAALASGYTSAMGSLFQAASTANTYFNTKGG
jgi:hypothetical protein